MIAGLCRRIRGRPDFGRLTSRWLKVPKQNRSDGASRRRSSFYPLEKVSHKKGRKKTKGVQVNYKNHSFRGRIVVPAEPVTRNGGPPSGYSQADSNSRRLIFLGSEMSLACCFGAYEGKTPKGRKFGILARGGGRSSLPLPGPGASWDPWRHLFSAGWV